MLDDGVSEVPFSAILTRFMENTDSGYKYGEDKKGTITCDEYINFRYYYCYFQYSTWGQNIGQLYKEIGVKSKACSNVLVVVVTFKDLKKRVSLEAPTTQQQSKLTQKLHNKPFWIWNTQEHKLNLRVTLWTSFLMLFYGSTSKCPIILGRSYLQ